MTEQSAGITLHKDGVNFVAKKNPDNQKEWLLYPMYDSGRVAHDPLLRVEEPEYDRLVADAHQQRACA